MRISRLDTIASRWTTFIWKVEYVQISCHTSENLRRPGSSTSPLCKPQISHSVPICCRKTCLTIYAVFLILCNDWWGWRGKFNGDFVQGPSRIVRNPIEIAILQKGIQTALVVSPAGLIRNLKLFKYNQGNQDSRLVVYFAGVFLNTVTDRQTDRGVADSFSTSSSSWSALQLWKSLGFLNNSLPLMSILDQVWPFYHSQLFQIVFDAVFPSGPGSAYRSICEWVPFVYFLSEPN